LATWFGIDVTYDIIASYVPDCAARGDLMLRVRNMPLAPKLGKCAVRQNKYRR